MHELAIHAHAYLRWILIALAIGFLVSRRAGLARALVGLVQLQVVVGVLLMVWLSPVTRAAWSAGLPAMLGDPTLLFFGALHPLAMLAGVGILEVGKAKARRGDPAAMRRATLGWLAVVALAIPWPGLPWGRPLARTPAPVIEAPEVYQRRCAACHGTIPQARAFDDAVWQASVTDARITAVIRDGGAAHGLTPLMPPHADLSADELAQLLAFIRSKGQP